MTTEVFLPAAVEAAVYRATYPDLREMDDRSLANHYSEHGKREGRTPNRLRTRQDFVALMAENAHVLEVGPFANPLAKGPNVQYADFLNREELIQRAEAIGIDASGVPNIEYVLSQQPLSAIEDDFDFVLTSHCLEHQPDLIVHLADVQRLIKARGGKYFALIPDKRFCFDHFMPETTVADILDSHVRGATVHSLKSVIEHRVLTTHNNPARHWTQHDEPKPVPSPELLQNAINEWRGSAGAYIDVHAWYFTPPTFVEIMGLLHSIRLTDLVVEAVYDPRFGSNEFWVVLGLSREC